MIGAMDIINDNWQVLSLVVPVLVALGSRYTSPGRVKLALAVAMTLASVGVSVTGMDWDMVGYEELFTRAIAIFGGAQLTFHGVNELLKSINQSDFNSYFAKEKGLG